VSAALRNVTSRLAAELDQPTSLAPDWTRLEWRLAPAVAAIHGVSGLLATGLQWAGPPKWAEFLARQRHSMRERWLSASRLLAAIGKLAGEQGVAITCLKGAALHSLGIYAPGERPMADLDLLVREEDLAPAHRILSSLGYQEHAASWKHRSYRFGTPELPMPLGEDPTSPVQIDLHTHIAERLPHRLSDISDLILTGAAKPGLNVYPSSAALMIHLLAHAAGSMVQRELRLVQLVDLVRVSRLMTSGDWEQILQYDGPRHRLWWASAPLITASRSFPHWAPPTEMKGLSEGCPRRLQRSLRRRSVAEMSYSRLRHDPFPGIAWTHSRREALAYVLARTLHARAQLAQTRLLVETEAWKPTNSDASRSQLSRLLHGMISRPLRLAATRVVRAALEEPVS